MAGRNDIGWLSWSWGGVPNGHCIPDFDHTYDGYFGDWRTSIASDMMVEHPFSLMRTAERPPSFFSNDTVQPAGIHISPLISSMMVGDTVTIEVLVAPANAFHQGYTVCVSGDGTAVDL